MTDDFRAMIWTSDAEGLVHKAGTQESEAQHPELGLALLLPKYHQEFNKMLRRGH